MKQIDFEAWIDSAAEPRQQEFRRAVHIVITAISLSPKLPDTMVMKGGILIAIAHAGDRFTRDIDFSTTHTVKTLPVEIIRGEIESHLAIAVEKLEYDLDCQIQACELKPPDPTKSWPTYIMKIGYAPYSHNSRHASLVAGNSPTVVKVECSYNEIMTNIEVLEVAPGKTINAYDRVDIIAEKLRALIQQPSRRRFRRQDVYDIHMLLTQLDPMDPLDKTRVLDSLTEKALSRGVKVSKHGLDDDEVRSRAENEYGLLDPEVEGHLPPFDEAYASVQTFYHSLPW